MLAEKIAHLTPGQKECLRLFHARHEIKDIARLLGRSEVTINQRLAAARRHLGVNRSSEAARLLVAYEGETDIPPIYESSPVGGTPGTVAVQPQDGARHWNIPMPFPTPGRTENDLSLIGKINYALLLAALVALVFGGTAAALSGLSDLF